jgi:ribosomal protein S6
MSETIMPAAEVNGGDERELQTYEFAFHVLPTVAEGEVPAVVESLKAHITKAGGQIFDEEVPQRFDLAYEIVKYLEGKNRKFTSAYFGWVRFRVTADALTGLTEELDAEKQLLRYLMIKLTKVEEAHPFRFHESIAHRKVETVSEGEEEVSEEVVEEVADDATEVVAEEGTEVAADADGEKSA